MSSSSAADSSQLVADINALSSFLAHEEVKSLESCDPVDCIAICVSSVFYQAEQLFKALENKPDLTKALVIVGGIGHSTKPLYDAVAKHPRYHPLADAVEGLPEARVLQLILEKYYDVDKITSKGCRILYEDKSTNCGQNAMFTRKVLENAGFNSPRSIMIIQDTTMQIRTIATFEFVYKDLTRPPKFVSCPVFVPKVKLAGPDIEYDLPDLSTAELWEKQRLYELLVGEIPRLRDDENGYGPKGKNFMSHVDVSKEIEAAAARISETFGVKR